MDKMWVILDYHDNQIGEIILGMPNPERSGQKALSMALFEWDKMSKDEQDRRAAFVLALMEVDENCNVKRNSGFGWIDIAQTERSLNNDES